MDVFIVIAVVSIGLLAFAGGILAGSRRKAGSQHVLETNSTPGALTGEHGLSDEHQRTGHRDQAASQVVDSYSVWSAPAVEETPVASAPFDILTGSRLDVVQHPDDRFSTVDAPDVWPDREQRGASDRDSQGTDVVDSSSIPLPPTTTTDEPYGDEKVWISEQSLELGDFENDGDDFWNGHHSGYATDWPYWYVPDMPEAAELGVERRHLPEWVERAAFPGVHVWVLASAPRGGLLIRDSIPFGERFTLIHPPINPSGGVSPYDPLSGIGASRYWTEYDPYGEEILDDDTYEVFLETGTFDEDRIDRSLISADLLDDDEYWML